MRFKTICLCWMLLMSFQRVSAQPLASTPSVIVAMGCSDGAKILLRWAPTEYDTWKKGNQYGYRIERFTTHINDVEMPSEDFYGTKVILESTLLPLAESQWLTTYPNNDNAIIAKGVLYDESMNPTMSNDPTLAEGLQQLETNESRLTFGLFAAEQDFEIAKGLALGFEDFSAESNHKYLYQISVNDPDQFFGSSGVALANLDDMPDLPVPTQVAAEGGDLMALIQWNQTKHDGIYTSYVVERSVDNINFAPASDLPFVFSSDDPQTADYAFYKDSLANNNDTYYYRVRGKTPFCTLGPPSDTVEVNGRAEKMTLSLSIKEEGISETNVSLSWNDFDSSLENQIEGFNVQRSEDPLKNFEPINENPISPSIRFFDDPSPIGAAYYRLEVVDQNGYIYHSPSHFVQLVDDEAPEIPSGLTGEFITTKTALLNWVPNVESDLKGYRLFAANKRDANYTQISNDDVGVEEFVYDITPEFMVDSIYFKIVSTDKRSNYSEMSEPFVLARPDVTGPSEPVLYKAFPTPAGIELAWRFSSSSDVVYHELQRKRKNAPNWESVLTIPVEEQENFSQNLSDPDSSITATCYIDEAELELREYEYRLLAHDDAQNNSSSDLLTILPYDSGLRGAISNFELDISCVPNGDIPMETAYNIMSSILEIYETEGAMDYEQVQQLVFHNIITSAEYNNTVSETPGAMYTFLSQRKMEVWGDNLKAEIKLGWAYDNMTQLQDFQIFRSAEGSAVMLYKTLKAEGLSSYLFKDEDVLPGRRYFYQIMARHLNGGYSELSEVIMAKAPGS